LSWHSIQDLVSDQTTEGDADAPGGMEIFRPRADQKPRPIFDLLDEKQDLFRWDLHDILLIRNSLFG